MSGSGCCYIVPPYILEALSRHADEATRERAQRTLELTRMLADRRMNLMPPVETLAPHPHDRRTIFDVEHGEFLPGHVVRREGEPAVADAAVNEAYDNAGITYDFYERVLGRRSVDGNGMRVLSTVHYSKHYDNAFWNGSQMVYGDGDGVVFGSFTNALDVIAHELTHGVTQMTCGLAYHGESGALNKSISDVFGSVVKQWNSKQSVDEADWLIGDGLIKDRKFGKALRSMKAPETAYDNIFMGGEDPQPAHYRDYYHGRDDEGGVHINSGIPNHAFYLVAKALGRNSCHVAAKVWYAAVTSQLSVRCSFAHFAARTIAIADEEHGAEAGKFAQQSWQRVGL